MSNLVRYGLVGVSYEFMKVTDKGDYVLFADAEQRIEELEKQLRGAQIKGFKDGWETSGEGYNAEHGANTDEIVNDYVNNLNSGE